MSAMGTQAESRSATAPNAKFGTSSRMGNYRRYNGPGMPNSAAAQCGDYIGQVSSLGKQHMRSSSPAFSFGRPKNSARRPKNGLGESNRPSTTPGQQRRGVAASSQGVEADFLTERPRTSPAAPGRPRPREQGSSYDWLRRYNEPNRDMKSTYLSALDGADMPKAREYSTPPKFSFGSCRRFEHNQYLPHGACQRPGTTPGHLYEIASTVGDAPKYTFPKDRNRQSPEMNRMERDQLPGPGAYNLTLEQRLDAITLDHREEAEQLEQLEQMEYIGAQASIDPSIAANTNISAETAVSLKFGAIPTCPSAPMFSFGTGDRHGRAKLFFSGDLNKEQTGKWSPGPAANSIENDRPSSPEFSFGGKNLTRNELPKACSSVGPAAFGSQNSIGEQLCSTNRSSPTYRIGTSRRDHADRLYTPGVITAQRGTPGPQYELPSSIGQQADSNRCSSPTFGFGSGLRPALVYKEVYNVPGPGSYNIASAFGPRWKQNGQGRNQKKKKSSQYYGSR